MTRKDLGQGKQIRQLVRKKYDAFNERLPTLANNYRAFQEEGRVLDYGVMRPEFWPLR